MGNRQRIRVAVAVGACVGALTGCSQTADGTAQWVSGQASKSIEGADVDDLLVDQTDVEDIVGQDLVDVYNTDTPIDEGDLAECEVFAITGQAAVLGDDWDRISIRTLDDQLDEDKDANYIVAEIAVIYPDAKAAESTFQSTVDMSKDCDGQERRSDSGATWEPKITESNDDSITWSEKQTDLTDEDWVCSGDARRRNNVIIRVISCRGDGEGPANSAAVANAMSNKVWELSSPDK